MLNISRKCQCFMFYESEQCLGSAHLKKMKRDLLKFEKVK